MSAADDAGAPERPRCAAIPTLAELALWLEDIQSHAVPNLENAERLICAVGVLHALAEACRPLVQGPDRLLVEMPTLVTIAAILRRIEARKGRG